MESIGNIIKKMLENKELTQAEATAFTKEKNRTCEFTDRVFNPITSFGKGNGDSMRFQKLPKEVKK